jgi:hypothetical protein
MASITPISAGSRARSTGISEFSDLEELDDELPEDIDDEEKYIQLPESSISAYRW